MENLIEKKGIVYLLRQSNFSRLLVGIAFFLSIVGTIASLMLPLIIRNVIDSFSYENIGMKDFFILGMILIVQLVFSYISSIILAFQGEKIVSDTRITIWHKLLRLKVNYFNSLSSGELTSYLIDDSVSIKNMITVQIPLFLNSCITLIGSVIILIAMDVQMTVLILLVVPTIALVTIPIGKRMSKLSRKNQDQLANLTGFSNQILGEIKLVKSANAEKFEEDRGDEKIKSLFKTGFAVSKLQALITPVILLL
ncbi:ABC transporter ATP-binding protein [Enterococcus faecium]|uniref:ABC transporter ATP-binding protein n=1 Tax=Enterococcus TaxID=1350 RepID=UPI0028106A8B|nr:ABC transporter ATP-binding protein [Enterococcus faecium]MDU5303821.1 ABC transporter ATP-binding protein [Enterococcus faecium]